MDKKQFIEELEFEIMMCQKTGHSHLIPGLEHVIYLLEKYDDIA